MKNGPSYREACPQFDVMDCIAAIGEGRRICCFFWLSADRLKYPRGIVEIADAPDEHHFVFTWLLFGPGLNGHGRQVIRTVMVEGTPYWKRPRVECPRCRELKDRLFFKDFWACGDCHKLKNRSHAYDRETRDFLARDAKRETLTNLLAQGRPKGMRRETFRRRKSELYNLSSDWPVASVPDRRFAPRIDCEWMAEDTLNQEQRHLLADARGPIRSVEVD